MFHRFLTRSALALFFAGAANALWAAPPVSEAVVKAAFVYNFAKYVEWPGDTFPSLQAPIRLCLYGNRDPFLAALAEMDGKVAQNRPIRVEKVAQRSDFQGCQILAVAESERRQFAETLDAAQNLATLMVGEWEGFAGAGGAIGLVVDDERVQFEVNLAALRRYNIKLSSQLLKLARKLYR